jgi:ubiquinone/menaquinone biosynthesis C-methylase UbiE
MKVDLMKRDEIFRDTRNWYLEKKNCASDGLIKFAVQNAGDTILDVGCATGDYCNKLKKLGFKCVGIDINREYIEKALENGIEAYIMSAENIKFLDNSFDTILLFEVLEHVEKLDHVLEEVKRVTKKNILITVPNCSDFYHLKKYCLTYEHMLEKDHVNFFTRESLENLLSKHFKNFKVKEKEPIALDAVNLPRWLKYPILLLYRLGIIKNNINYRLYAVIEV